MIREDYSEGELKQVIINRIIHDIKDIDTYEVIDFGCSGEEYNPVIEKRKLYIFWIAMAIFCILYFLVLTPFINL